MVPQAALRPASSPQCSASCTACRPDPARGRASVTGVHGCAGGGLGLGGGHPGLLPLDSAQPARALPLEHRDAVRCAPAAGPAGRPALGRGVLVSRLKGAGCKCSSRTPPLWVVHGQCTILLLPEQRQTHAPSLTRQPLRWHVLCLCCLVSNACAESSVRRDRPGRDNATGRASAPAARAPGRSCSAQCRLPRPREQAVTQLLQGANLGRQYAGTMAERGMDAVYRAARITSRSDETPLAPGARP